MDEGKHIEIHYNINKHFKINKFLLECNKLMDGIYLEEITETHLAGHIKFEAKLTCLYANPMYWSPTPLFFECIMRAGKKYLGVETVEDFHWNNTSTIFWIEKEKIK